MRPKVIIRADGGTLMGMGHVVRCLALADMLKNDFNIIFAIQEPDESIIKKIQETTEAIIHLPKTTDYASDAAHFKQFFTSNDIVLLDGYHFKTDYQKAIKEKGCKLVCIDDLHAWHQLADIIINHADGTEKSMYSAEPYTKLCLGLDYALLRKEFLVSDNKIKKISSIKNIFISMGAADKNNITQKFLEGLVEIEGIKEIHIMLGSVNPNLKSIDDVIHKNKHLKIVTHFNISSEELAKLLTACDLCICPASSISLESCAIGIGLISGYTAENQLGILNGLKRNNVLVDFEDLNKITSNQIKEQFEFILKDIKQFDLQIQNQKKLIDRRSPERLLNVFKKLASERLHFRPATESDVDLYYKWTNDPMVRSNSFNQKAVEYKDHVNWFRSKLVSLDCYFYLFMNEENIPVGQVRIDKSENETVIGVSIDEEFRGKGVGSRMLEMATDNYLNKYPLVYITAYIKVENVSSYKIFKKAGFTNEQIVTEQGFKSYKLFKTSDLHERYKN